MAKAGAQTSLLYICGSLPLFLGGELSRAGAARSGADCSAHLLLTGLVVVLAVAPLASAPGLLSTDDPRRERRRAVRRPGVAKTIGIGVAVSIAGVMLCEYLALTRLIHAHRPVAVRPIAAAIGAAGRSWRHRSA